MAELFNPDTIRDKVLEISIFIGAYESLKKAIVEKPQIMYSDLTNININNGKIIWKTDKNYKSEVQDRHKHIDQASLLWIHEHGGVDEEDIKSYNLLRQRRNILAHEMLDQVFSFDASYDPELFLKSLELFSKIEKWWFRWFEMEVNPELNDMDIDLDSIIYGKLTTLSILIEALFNNDEDRYTLYNKILEEVSKK